MDIAIYGNLTQWKCVTSGNRAYGVMLETLLKIGTPEARAAVARLSTHSTDWIARNVNLTLQRWK